MTTMIVSSLREQTNRVLATLSSQEERVLRLRFGIGENHPLTVEEVGRHLAVPHDRIRQIEVEALRKLRNPLGRSDEDFY